MKKIISIALAVLLAAALLLSIAACAKSPAQNGGKTDNSSTAASKNDKRRNDGKTNGNGNGIGTIAADLGSAQLNQLELTPADCDENGFYIFIANADAEYKIAAEDGGDGSVWEVYVLKDKYSGDTAAFKDSNTPALTGNGKVSVVKGYYVYVHCSIDARTDKANPSGAKICIAGNGVPSK